MELEKGMYVRLNCNYELGIGKTIGEIDEDNFIKTKFKDDFECSLPTYMITKASHNIIDLIEDDDLIKFKIYGELFICKVYNKSLINYDGEVFDLEELDIVSILTKEQYESMSYKVGE